MAHEFSISSFHYIHVGFIFTQQLKGKKKKSVCGVVIDRRRE